MSQRDDELPSDQLEDEAVPHAFWWIQKECPNGHPVDKGSSVCGVCGARWTKPTHPPTDENDQPATAPKAIDRRKGGGGAQSGPTTRTPNSDRGLATHAARPAFEHEGRFRSPAQRMASVVGRVLNVFAALNLLSGMVAAIVVPIALHHQSSGTYGGSAVSTGQAVAIGFGIAIGAVFWSALIAFFGVTLLLLRDSQK